MTDQRRRANLPSMYGNHTGGTLPPIREIINPAYVEVDGLQQDKKSLPLPDYDTLYPQKRHGVKGSTGWDHLMAEVTQKYREAPPELMGPEMSVDGPLGPRSSVSQERNAGSPDPPQRQETKPVSPKRTPAPAPPNQVASPLTPSIANSSQKPSQSTAQQSLTSSNQYPNPAAVQDGTSSTGVSKDGARKVLHPPPAAMPRSRSTSPIIDTTPSDDLRKVNKEPPSAKPRQNAGSKEPVQQQDFSVNNNQTSVSRTGKENGQISTEPVSKGPWAQQKHNQEVDYLVTGSFQKDSKPEESNVRANNIDVIFIQENPAEPITSFSGNDSIKLNEYKKKDDDSKQASSALQRRNSQRGKNSLQSSTLFQQKPASKEGTILPAATQSFPSGAVPDSSVTLQPQADEGYDLFGAKPFIPKSSEPLPVVMEELASQAGSLSAGKTPLRAYVSPNEVQSVSSQNSNGGGLAFPSRRPHPVKPMNPAENQQPFSALKGTKVPDSTPQKVKVVDGVGSGPYTQLTQEELISMVVKQQTDLSKKDAKIGELEEYIDNLLVRVMEKEPAILQALAAPKPV